MLSGKKLIEDIDSKNPEAGTFYFWWLGQQSYIVKTKSFVFYFDPFLSDHGKRQIAPLLKPQDITNADFVLGTHNHRDHIDKESLPGILSASPHAKLIIPALVEEDVEKTGIDRQRMTPLDDECFFESCGIKVTGIKAKHEFFDNQGEYYPHLQYIVECDNVKLYHAGDTLLYDGMLSRLKGWDFINIAFLPINGRDAARLARKCYGNMTYQEAVDLAGELQPGIVVPGHYGMFPDNTEDPQKFSDYMSVKFPEQKFLIAEPGISYYSGSL